MKELAVVFAVVVAAGCVALWANMAKHFFRVLEQRSSGVPRSAWLIYEPKKLSSQGVRSLWRYWFFGLALVAWAFGGLIVCAALIRA